MTEDTVRLDDGAEGMDTSTLSPAGHEVMTQAEALSDALEAACDESMWVRTQRKKAVCWEALRLQFGRGRNMRDVGAMFGVHPTTISWRKTKDKWRLLTREELKTLSARVAEAIVARRILLDTWEGARADAAACEWTPVAELVPVVRVVTGDVAAALSVAPDQVRGDTSPGFAEGGQEPAPWNEVAHAAQLPPEGAWRTWVLMGGRGAGKTRAGAEWVRGLVEMGIAKRIALVGPSLHDVREVMISGPSGLCAIGDPALRPTYEVTRRRLVWPPVGLCAGAVAFAFSAEDPDSLRGPQFDLAWCDEIGAWANDVKTWSTLAFGMRLGPAPRIVATTTPRPRELVKLLVKKGEMKRGGVVITRAATRANAINLSPEFVAGLEEDYAGTELGRQELDGELIEDLEGALWSRAMIDDARAGAGEAEGLERVVVAVDPPVTATGKSDACGIIVAGVKAGVVYVLADATVRGLKPAAWAERVMLAARGWGAGTVVAESNQGGEMVREVLERAGAELEGGARLRVKLQHAKTSKRERAQPVSVLYTTGRVRHVRVLKELEDEMCSFGAAGDDGRRARSPDRVDALVWAVDELMSKRARPRAERF